MRAARFYAADKPLSIESCPRPVPESGEVLVRVKACGVCGSDVHMRHGRVPVRKSPIILGHEIAGVVADVGTGGSPWKEGDAVIVRAGGSCGTCAFCQSGRDNLCSRQRVLGMDEDGGFAEHVKAPAASLVPLPEGVPFETAAILSDAVATPYHALVARGALRPGESVAVFGCGGLGIHAVQLARLFGASVVIAVDVRQGPLERARSLGAEHLVNAAEEEPDRAIRRLTGDGVDLAVECVGRATTVAQAAKSLRPGGRVVVVGMGDEPLTLAPPALFSWREHAVVGSFGRPGRTSRRSSSSCAPVG